MEPTLASGHGQPGSSRPRLALPVMYSNLRSKPDPVCKIPISPTVGKARFAGFHLAGHLPGLACDMPRSFSRLSSSCGSSFSNFESTTCLLARDQRCIRVTARCPQAAYEAEAAMPLYRPPDTVGARGMRSTLIRRISRHDKCHESRFCLTGKYIFFNGVMS